MYVYYHIYIYIYINTCKYVYQKHYMYIHMRAGPKEIDKFEALKEGIEQLMRFTIFGGLSRYTKQVPAWNFPGFQRVQRWHSCNPLVHISSQ